MQLDMYRKIYFTIIQGYPNVINNELSNCIPKFSRSNAVTSEDHNRAFQNTMDNFDIEHEDVYAITHR